MAGPDPARPLEPEEGASRRRQIYLQPSQLHATALPTEITTVLGSCVAVCLHDPVASVGGMNHYMLPYPVRRERSTQYGNVAIEDLVAAVERLGARRQFLRAKVFGGAALLASRPGHSLGDQNAQVAVELLAEFGIPILDGDVGGTRGRKLLFHTDSGTVWVRML